MAAWAAVADRDGEKLSGGGSVVDMGLMSRESYK
jgi:hypothetical protein